MRSKIAWKLAACFIGTLVLFAMLTGSIFLFLFRQHITDLNRIELEERTYAIARTFAQMPSEGLGHVESHSEIVDGYGVFMRFLYEMSSSDVWIVSPQHELMTYGHGHHGQIDYKDLPPSAEQIVDQVLQGEQTYSEEFSQVLNTPTLTVGAPIVRDDGTVIGAVLLHSPVSGVEEAVSQGVWALSGGIGIALTFALAVSAALSYTFTKPLHSMNATARGLANGDYSVKTGVKQNDEIGQLAHTLDNLAGRLEGTARQQAALEKMREDFVANVSHELRTPITVLRGSLEVLCDGTVDDPQEIREYFEQMFQESLHMERLVNDLLELSRLQDTDFALNVSQLDLGDLLDEVCMTMRRTAQGKRLEILLLRPACECLIEGDYDRVRQMLLVVLHNAVKFSEPKGQIVVRQQIQEHSYLVTVTDYGIGISAENLPHIFERFHKTLSEQNSNGAGLGLAIAQQIAQRHGIQLSAQSEPGVKTVFTFLFPQKGANDVQE